MGLRIVLWYAPKEVQCPTHGRVQEEIPWAPPYAWVTYRLEWRLCALCQIMTQKAAAEILRLPTSTLSNLLHRVITRVRHGHTIRGLTTLGVDEISYRKGRKFATLVYDLGRARVLWVGFSADRSRPSLTGSRRGRPPSMRRSPSPNRSPRPSKQRTSRASSTAT